MRTLTDKDFRMVEDSRKAALADLVKRSGLPFSHIAEATGVERRAVKRAAAGEGIRFDTATRIEFYLEWLLNNKENEEIAK